MSYAVFEVHSTDVPLFVSSAFVGFASESLILILCTFFGFQ